MPQLDRFPKNRVLREQMVLVRKNDPVSLLGIVIAAAIASYIIYSEIADTTVLYWFGMVVFVTTTWGFLQRLFEPTPSKEPRPEARIRVMMAILYSVLWGWMVVTYLPDATPLMLVAITMISGALVAGSVATQSASVPLCLGFVGPNLLAVIIALISRGDFLDMTLAIGAVLYFIALTFCMVTMEMTVRRSIELRFDKEGLIRQLRMALEETEEATNAKSMFLASASHDLRQPIQAMSLVTEAIKGTELNNYQKTLHGHLESAVDSTHRMLDSLLDFSKVDAGVIRALITPFSVRAMFERLSSELKPLADEKRLTYRCRKTDAIANSDMQIVEMILRNLITNAIRYTNKGGVLLLCRKRPSSNLLSFEVWDTGIGVSARDQEAIFKEFQQVDNPERDSQKGFGLGLAISQGLAKTISSEISVHSRPGKGSVFRLSVPLSDATIIEDEKSDGAVVNFAGKSIMVIDDNERIRVSMKTLLESWGCHCVATDSTQKALQYVAYRQPDLLLVDYRLRENKTGSEAINTIRTFVGKDVPAVIITGDTAADRLHEVGGAEAEFMHKPVSAAALKKMIRAMIQTQA